MLHMVVIGKQKYAMSIKVIDIIIESASFAAYYLVGAVWLGILIIWTFKIYVDILLLHFDLST